MKKTIDVHTTSDYSVFKHLVGNREVTNKRVGIIKASIKDVGYISNPIIVNEKMEVIDGQGRLEALKQLGIPVEYRVVDGIGIRECMAMNLKPTSWTSKDYVNCYAEQGVEDYIIAKNVSEMFGMGINAVCRLCSKDQKFIYSGETSTCIKTGNLSMKSEDECIRILRYASMFKNIASSIGGRSDMFICCVCWVSSLNGVDKDRLLNNVISYTHLIHPTSTLTQCLTDISAAYNYKARKASWRNFAYERDQIFGNRSE